MEGLLYFALLYALWRRLRGPDGTSLATERSCIWARLGAAAFLLRLVIPVGFYVEPFSVSVAHPVHCVHLLYVVGVEWRPAQLAAGHSPNAQAAPWRWAALVLLLILRVFFLEGGATENGVDRSWADCIGRLLSTRCASVLQGWRSSSRC